MRYRANGGRLTAAHTYAALGESKRKGYGYRKPRTGPRRTVPTCAPERLKRRMLAVPASAAQSSPPTDARSRRKPDWVCSGDVRTERLAKSSSTRRREPEGAAAMSQPRSPAVVDAATSSRAGSRNALPFADPATACTRRPSTSQRPLRAGSMAWSFSTVLRSVRRELAVTASTEVWQSSQNES
jgi:hypothetical protein